MICCRCGRRILKSAGDTDRGPLGPVCARRLGLPRRIARMRKDGLPRARTAPIFSGTHSRVRAYTVDPAQTHLEFA